MKGGQAPRHLGRASSASDNALLDYTWTEDAPRPKSPLSQAVSIGAVVFTAGLVGVEPATGVAPEGIEAQTRQTLRNLEAVLAASGSSLARVAKVTIFLKDIEALPAVNAIYAEFFRAPFPARTTIQAQLASTQLLIEVEAVALRVAP